MADTPAKGHLGPHAALLAHDPVWRPLYQEPAFVKRLADRGQELAYAH